MRLLILLFILITISFSFTTFRSINDYPKDYFRSPVDHPIYLSGTFGELRPNHFHAGIDIKSRDGKIGQPLFAIADGFVSRIKVSSGGYGNVLYFDHPNGFTSVYAHLHRFPAEIAEYVKAEQYQKECFEIELFPSSEQFQVSKGDVVGWMGISGRSFGPHLHFEIRDTRTEKPINPLLFGMPIVDNIPPKLHQLKVYLLNHERETFDTKTYNLQKVGKTYRIKGDMVNVGATQVGFAIKAYDHMNRTSNWNGVYSIDMFKDSLLWYNMTMETFSFDETRYINAHLDYDEQVSKKSYFNRCFALPGNAMTSIYHDQMNGGIVQLLDDEKRKIQMEVKDVNGNAAKLDFWIKRGEVNPPDAATYNYFLPYDEENIVDNGSVRLFFPEGALYEDLYLQYQASADASSDIYSGVHHIHHHKIPVHKYYDISIRPNRAIEGDQNQLFIGYCGKDNKITNCGGEWKDGFLQSKVRDLGDYCIMRDAVPPVIDPKRFSSNMRGYSRMTFKITDNLPTARNIEGLTYRATIDEQWILLEYDAKNDLLTHRFEDQLSRGEHQFRLVVTDACQNEAVLEKTFIR